MDIETKPEIMDQSSSKALKDVKVHMSISTNICIHIQA
jgi:hypothetical protein